MRERQFVVSLRPEQFQRVQQMARAAGAHSVGSFLRQRLFSSLGFEEAETVGAEALPSWQVIGGQVRRLHRELQLFIAESKSDDDDQDFPFEMQEDSVITAVPSESASSPPAGTLQPPPSAAPSAAPSISPSKASFSAANDPMEQLADRAFAISPRLGAIDPLQDLLEDSLLEEPIDDPDELEHDDEADAEIDAMTGFQSEESAAQLDPDEPEHDTEYGGDPDHGVTTDEADAEIDAMTGFQSEESAAQLDPDEPEHDTEYGGDPDHGVTTDEEQLHESSYADDSDDEVKSAETGQITDENDENLPNSDDQSGGFTNPPPISGGPPPRKRRT